MFRKREVPIGELVREFLRAESLEMPLAEYRAEQAWTEVVGEGIGRYTRSVRVKGGTMYVELRSPALRANLLLGRANLMNRINAVVGVNVITNLVLL